MDDLDIKTRPVINLKPNKYFTKVDWPFLYQKRMVLMMLKRPDMVNGDDVGLGKTAESIIHYSYVKSADETTRALVFTEKISLDQWKDAFKFLCPDIRVKIITAETHPDIQYRISALRQFYCDVLITTYSTAYDYRKYVMEGMGPRFVLYADEPSYFKDDESKLHAAMMEIAQAAIRKYGLTATFIENRLEEGYAILKVIAPWCMPSKQYFKENFCVEKLFKRPRYFKRVVGYKNLNLFRAQIEPAYYGRLQTDPEVNQALPEVIETDWKVMLSKEQSKKVVEAMNGLLTMASGEVSELTVLTTLTRQQQLVNDPGLLNFNIGKAKVDALIEALKGHLNGQKVIIHSWMETQITRLADMLDHHKIKYLRITGPESDAERIRNKQIFNMDGDMNVLLVTKAGLRAGDFQAGAHFIWFDLPWSWGLYKQGVGRIKRTGSLHRKVGSHRMLAVLHPDTVKTKGDDQTIDGYHLEVLKKKAKIVNAVTDDADDMEAVGSTMREVYVMIAASRGGSNV